MTINSATVPISSIIVGDRAREDYGDDSDIVESAKGFMKQIQSLAVRQAANNQYELIAGGRRLEAFKKADMTEVLVRIYPSNLTNLEMKSIELMENIARLNLTWQEQTKLTEDIHQNQINIHGIRESPADKKG